MKHLNMQTPNGEELNLDALYKIAPSCFTEAKGDDGEMHRVVDFNKLRLLLGDNAVEDAPEVYDFTWVGKRAALQEAAAPINKTLRPCPEESVDWDKTQNLYIEGDNLEVLKLLQNSYMGKVKMIYIDPPYNTGNDFVYHDDFAQSAEEYDANNQDEYGNRYRKNTDSNGRFHSDWCSMIYARLMIARSLLTEDGVIFISIDTNEVGNLRRLCNEIFGDSNCLGEISNTNNPKGRSDDKYIATAHEYILCYAKNIDSLSWFGFEPGEEILKRYNKVDDQGRRFRDIDLRKTGENDLREDRPNLFYYFIYNQSTGEFYPSRDKVLTNGCLAISPVREDGKEGNWRWGIDSAKKQISELYPKFMPTRKIWGVMQKDYLDGRGLVKPTSSWTFKDVNSERGTEEFISLGFDKRVFPKPKPLRTICRLLKLATSHNSSSDIILDFFSGSATTAHAVMQLNAEDSGNRKYIMVQLSEETPKDSEAYKSGYNTIPEIAKERIRRAGKKIKEENPLTTQDLDTGFRVFKCESSNYKDVAFAPKDYNQGMLEGLLDNIKEDRSDLDLLFDCKLRWGVELSLPLSTTEVDGCTIHNVNDGDLVACFSGNVTEKVIDAIADLSPLRVVFRDNSFTEAAQKMNLFELFKQKCDWTDEEVRNNVRII